MTAPVGDDLTWLDDLERAHAAATPGPWHVDGEYPDVFAQAGEVGKAYTRADAATIVAEHNAVPTLIAELRKRDAALDRVKALLPRIGDLIEFEQEGERDVVALMQVRDHLAAALTPESVPT